MLKISDSTRRDKAEDYLRIVLISYALTVIGVRTFLALTHYPTLSAVGLQIAHVVWGGLFMFVAGLLVLIFEDKHIYTISALLNGAGAGLFVDEIGKFITPSSNYFYPLAAPIIYAFFLLLLLLYFRVNSGTRQQNPWLEEFWVRWFGRLGDRWQTREDASFASRKKLTSFLGVSFLIYTLTTLGDMILLVTAYLSPEFAAPIARQLLLSGRYFALQNLSVFILRLLIEVGVGILYALAALFLIKGDVRRGINLGYFGLLVSITMLNLLVFYLDQFQAVLGTLIQFTLLSVLLAYRQRYL